MAIHWQIQFHSLRANIAYRVNIHDASYRGSTPIQLKGGAKPFVTQEDDDEDEFTPMRTQSGYLRIVDDGLDANGNAWNWRDILPMTDTDRPVTLTDASGNIYWQGFMQAQNFGGVLYGNPQEREFPIQCGLSILRTVKASTSENNLRNFAYLAYQILVTGMPSIVYTDFVFQGGADARTWLLKKLDWTNFLTETEEGTYEAKYTHYDILEDVCRFMGWTVRTRRNVVYFTCMDDSDEQKLLTLTSDQLLSLANGSSTTAGVVSSSINTIALSGDIFASTDNNDFRDRGPCKATVKAYVNENEQVVKVLPVSVENELDAGGWHWAHSASDPDGTGYFETGMIYSFDTPTLKGYNYSSYGAFSLRQIYSNEDDDSAKTTDMILIDSTYGQTSISLETKKPMAYAGGSLILSGQVFFGSQPIDMTERPRLLMRIGIGMTRSSARWWYLDPAIYTDIISSGWSNPGVTKTFYAGAQGGNIVSTSCLIGSPDMKNYKSIPVANEANLYGYLFIDFCGLEDDTGSAQTFQIANFTVKFSRDSVVMPTSVDQPRAREVSKDRVDSQEYTSENNSSTGIEWNADCIFASDNNMTYGYGLLMEPDGRYLSTFPYNGSAEHPEQHLADRVTSFWSRSRRRLSVNLRTDVIIEPRPSQKASLDGTTFHPISISHDWRDDITMLTFLEMP